jgi:prepilin-type N-terminal cleavage/methylation domain-containing protein
MKKTSSAFTLIELLMVISIIALLSAILFPVFVSAKRSAQKVVGISNVSGIGKGTLLYMADSDDTFPSAVDSSHRLLFLRSLSAAEVTEWGPIIRTAPTYHEIMKPYVASKEIFRYPLDNGAKFTSAFTDSTGATVPINAFPTAYQYLGTSFAYRAELGLAGIRGSSLQCKLGDGTDISSSGTAMMMTFASQWGGDARSFSEKNDTIVFVDGHTKTVNINERIRAWLCGLS